MKIPSTRGLMPGSRQIDRAARENRRGITAEMMAAAEALLEAQYAQNPHLAGPKHNRDLRHHLGNLIY